KRRLVGRARVGVLACSRENVASEIRVDSGERVVGLHVERAQSIVVSLLVEQRLGQSETRYRLDLLFGRMIDHPLQLRLGGGFVATIVQQLRVQQSGARRIGGACELRDELRSG